MKSFNVITSFIAMFILSIGAVLYPFWLINGVLDSWYLIIMLPIVIYGGLIANIVWLIDFLKRNKK